MTRSSFFADLSLARRVEAADAWIGLESARIHAQLEPSSGAASMPVPGGYALFTGVTSPLTQVLGLGMEGMVTGSQLDEIEDFFLSRSANVQIEACPLAHSSLLPLLSRRGYSVGSFSNMLVRKLTPPVPSVSTSAVSVRQCAPSEAELWAKTVLEGFIGAMALVEGNTSILTSLFHQPNAICLLAQVEGIPAGAGALSVHEGVAAMYGASTLPAFRRRGIQSAIIQAIVVQAIDAGCDVAFTLTQPGSASQRNLERQDFRVAYTRATMVRRFGTT